MTNSAGIKSACRRVGFTVIELLLVIVIIGVLLGLMLPATRGAREAARRMSCSNNFKQIGLGLHNYHSAYKQLPMAMGGTDRGTTSRGGNANRLSGLVAVLPFIEQQALWEQISNPAVATTSDYPPMGPVPWHAEYTPWAAEIPTYRCPSATSDSTKLGMTNYAFCIGDMVTQVHRPPAARGVFACLRSTNFSLVTDGLSNTIAMGEIGTPNDLSLFGQFAIKQSADLLSEPRLCNELRDPQRTTHFASEISLSSEGRGTRWADGAAGFSLVNTVLPPNSPSCAVNGTEAVDGVYSVGSFHAGGGHVLMADGAVVFTTEDIQSGEPQSTPLTYEQIADGPVASPLGLWGALGSAAGDDRTDETLLP
ncbi:MAG: DUF1559 domain-containing protein [Pirellulaceae bacterium]|nr:DUF1559 domain-containing protein [Pirellulaceae bacterium]